MSHQQQGHGYYHPNGYYQQVDPSQHANSNPQMYPPGQSTYAYAGTSQYPMAGQPAPSGLPGQPPAGYPMYRTTTPAPGTYRTGTPNQYVPAGTQHAAMYPGAHPPTPAHPPPPGQGHGQGDQSRYIYASWPPPPNPSMPQSVPSEDRPFACQLCSKSFARENDFRRHYDGHKGEKPYVCSCGTGYARKDALKRHKDTSGHT